MRKMRVALTHIVWWTHGYADAEKHITSAIHEVFENAVSGIPLPPVPSIEVAQPKLLSGGCAERKTQGD
jgi:hypothetical protein